MDKHLVHHVVDSFSDDVDIVELRNKLRVMEEIRLGEMDIDEGRFLTNEEAKKRFDRWLTAHQAPNLDS